LHLLKIIGNFPVALVFAVSSFFSLHEESANLEDITKPVPLYPL